jgi:AmmeMemoRadiSam system protein A
MNIFGSGETVPEMPAPASPAPSLPSLSAGERRLLLQLARQTLIAATAGGRDPEPPADGLTRTLTEPRACFVTLTRNGSLRGCIGHLSPKEPLWKAVIENGRYAALYDPRFPPVSASELGQIEIEISVLTEPRPLEFRSPEDLLNKLQPGQDGVVLESGSGRATFLPQVWDDLPDKVVFLGRLCQKGGWDENAWREPGMNVSIYHVEALHGSDRDAEANRGCA